MTLKDWKLIGQDKIKLKTWEEEKIIWQNIKTKWYLIITKIPTELGPWQMRYITQRGTTHHEDFFTTRTKALKAAKNWMSRYSTVFVKE